MQNNTENASVVSCLWLLAGLVGASVVAAGLHQLLDPELLGIASVAAILAGGVVTVASWRRGRIALEQAKEPWTKEVETSMASAARVSRADAEGADGARARPYSAGIGSK